MIPIESLLKDRNPLINTWLTIPSPWVAEIISNAGYDAITLDMQHGLLDYRSAVTMIQVTKQYVTTMVRVPWNDPGIIGKILDAGAMGIICPMVNNREEAEKLVSSCSYPPLGNRSFGPIRAGMLTENYFEDANHYIVIIAQIETQEAYNNLEDILTTPGIDGIYIGTIDLSISLGLVDHGNLANETLFSTVRDIVTKAKKHQKLVGIHSMDLADIDIVEQLDVDIITPLNDTRIIASKSRQLLNDLRARLN